MDRKLIGLFPQGVRSIRPRLFAVLERAYPVTFEERDSGNLTQLHGAVVFGDSGRVTNGLGARGIPLLVVPESPRGPAESPANAVPVKLAESSLLNPTLRGRNLDDCRAGQTPPLAVSSGYQVLASHNRAPLWVASPEGRSRVDRAAVSPLGPLDGQPLRDQLRQGQFLSLLPLVHFLRAVTADQAWSYPSLRASFVVDDPNLHWPSYGYLDYPTLVREAHRFGYHVAVAMVPLDGGFARSDVTRVFQEAQECLSLIIHGNDHSRHELEELRSEGLALAAMAQALRRVESFERRSQVPVSRIMAAPHERCSEETMRAMLQLGFEGICIDWRYPWRFRPDAEPMLAGFDQAELLAGGLPLIARDYLAASKEDLVFRAFLNQPLILYGHHQDLCEGLDVLRAGAEEVNRLGAVEWSSLSAIARTNFGTRMEGTALAVRMLSRRIIVDLPENADAIRIETPVVHGGTAGADVTINGRRHRLSCTEQGWRSNVLPMTPGTVEISLDSRPQIDPASVPSPRRRVWPLVRRVLGESRDRLQPITTARRSRDAHPAVRTEASP